MHATHVSKSSHHVHTRPPGCAISLAFEHDRARLTNTDNDNNSHTIRIRRTDVPARRTETEIQEGGLPHGATL
jgi:hypothetical protein